MGLKNCRRISQEVVTHVVRVTHSIKSAKVYWRYYEVRQDACLYDKYFFISRRRNKGDMTRQNTILMSGWTYFKVLVTSQKWVCPLQKSEENIEHQVGENILIIWNVLQIFHVICKSIDSFGEPLLQFSLCEYKKSPLPIIMEIFTL